MSRLLCPVLKTSVSEMIKVRSSILLTSREKWYLLTSGRPGAPPCRAEFPSIQTFYDRFKSNKDLVFLTVNLDEQTALGKMYLEKEQFTVPFLVAEGSIPTAFFNGSLPTTVVLDRSGKIRMHHAGMADYSKESFYQEINQLLNEK